ncbi:CDP-alcohol phosphatidyltransferase family protein [Zavarzinia compransoris]|uniref:CDP-diacylglycerol O-phosphatidyltransferase n=1 Tax=Zavarzinia compransoris TaxID=1264899 RepID=A0A317DZW8_9PROT|nr:phosphatidylcholine/phosphatidylserine synthase [Zavarzinia compransoris]PWR19714.1 CDP-diacylglycerol O-phosphatidyltransferase [Zavarzinia compransoris]TDP43339.1 CDP-diacylglycerol--serine O-phosphatidyltransferase [Zavarzinia compransoris]
MSDWQSWNEKATRRRRRLHLREARLNRLPVRSLLPNILTTLALCAGLTSIRFALDDKFELAVAAIMIAGFLDGIDGRVARLLKGTSRFGAELDSLSDFLSFGVAPVVVLYLWTLQELSGLGWIAVLSHAVCCALRLARFNVAIDDPDKPAWTSAFFTGVPSPAGAALVLLPIIGTFATGLEVFRSPWFVAGVAVTVAFLMVSRLPTLSFKKIRVHRDWVLPTLVFVGIGTALALSYPWQVLCLVIIAYAATIPFGPIAWRKALNKAALRATEEEAGQGPAKV